MQIISPITHANAVLRRDKEEKYNIPKTAPILMMLLIAMAEGWPIAKEIGESSLF